MLPRILKLSWEPDVLTFLENMPILSAACVPCVVVLPLVCAPFIFDLCLRIVSSLAVCCVCVYVCVCVL